MMFLKKFYRQKPKRFYIPQLKVMKMWQSSINVSFFITEQKKNIVCDSSIGNKNFEALSFKADLSNKERNCVISYLKQRMKDPNDRATLIQIKH